MLAGFTVVAGVLGEGCWLPGFVVADGGVCRCTRTSALSSSSMAHVQVNQTSALSSSSMAHVQVNQTSALSSSSMCGSCVGEPEPHTLPAGGAPTPRGEAADAE